MADVESDPPSSDPKPPALSDNESTKATPEAESQAESEAESDRLNSSDEESSFAGTSCDTEMIEDMEDYAPDWAEQARDYKEEKAEKAQLKEDNKMVLPAFAEEVSGAITFNLAGMETETRVRVELIVNMYAEKPSYFERIINPIALVADMLGKEKAKIACVARQGQIRRWDWRTDLPRVDKLEYDHRRLMEGLFTAISDDRTKVANQLKGALPKLKSWRHYTRLWKAGRKLYSDFQHLMPGCSIEEVEAAIYDECQEKGQTEKQLKAIVATKLRKFREEKQKEEGERAINERANTDTGVVIGTQVIEATSTADATPPTSLRSSARLRGRSLPTNPALVTPAPTLQRHNRTTLPKRRSLPMVAAAPTSTAVMRARSRATTATTAKKRQRTLTPCFIGTTNKPKLAGGPTPVAASETNLTGLVPPRLMRDDKGNEGYSEPSEDWVEQQMDKLAVVKHFVNCCAVQGIVAPRAELDAAIDSIMGGGANYDRAFILLLTAAISDNMCGSDQALLEILSALKDAKLLSQEAIANSTASALKKIVSPHDKHLRTAWIVKMCGVLVNKHNGSIPASIQELLALEIPEISIAVASTVTQQGFGWYYGPVVDQFYGTRMAIALDLIETLQYHSDKFKIKADHIEPHYIRESLLQWLPPREWKGFHTLMVSMAQIIVDDPSNKDKIQTIKKIMEKRFPAADKLMLAGMIEHVYLCFGILIQTEEKEGAK